MIQFIQFTCGIHGQLRITGQQTLNTQRNIIETTSGIQSRTQGKTQVCGHQSLRIFPGDGQQCFNAWSTVPGANTHQPLMHQRAINLIQWHHIGHGSQCHQIQPSGHIRFGNIVLSKPIIGPQLTAESTEQIEGDAHTCKVLSDKGTAGLIGINDGRRIG